MSLLDRLLAHWDTVQLIPEQAPLPPPVPLVVTLGGGERFYRCRGCDVTWQGTDPACWCCGEVAA